MAKRNEKRSPWAVEGGGPGCRPHDSNHVSSGRQDGGWVLSQNGARASSSSSSVDCSNSDRISCSARTSAYMSSHADTRRLPTTRRTSPSSAGSMDAVICSQRYGESDADAMCVDGVMFDRSSLRPDER